jgi:hypothetical protein
MRFSLDVLPARKGDCLILHYGTENEPRLVMIDGGPSGVYKPHLKPRLAQLRKKINGDNDKPLSVELLMVSHIDDDHIHGIIDLTDELGIALAAKKPLPIKLRGLWHNSFDDIIGNNPEEFTAAVTAQFGAAALTGEFETEGLELTVALVLAGVAQGRELRDAAKKLKLALNPQFDGKLVMTKTTAQPIEIDGLKLTIVGPMQPELEALRREHDAWLKKHPEEQRTVASLAAFTDESVPNLSSIVVLAELEGTSMLLTGDARGDKILEGLQLVGKLDPGDTSTMEVDLLKVPHHGSSRNMRTDFFERVLAKHYVFSGNGQHGNPERDTLEMLFEARGEEPFVMHFTYPIEEIEVERKKDWEKEQNKEKLRKKNNSKAKVRADWSDEANSLTAFFKERKLAKGQEIKIVQEGQPHVIDLLDKVGF